MAHWEASGMIPPGMALGPRSGAASTVNFAIMRRMVSNASLAPEDFHSNGSIRSEAPFFSKGVNALACSANDGQNLR